MRLSAALLIALAACDAPQPNAPDAAVAGGDASPMADADPSAPVEVTVTMWLGEGKPDATAFVVFADSNGTVVAHIKTDANGVARAMLPTGGSVTVLQAWNQPNDFTHRTDYLTTYRGVKPGDHLRAGGIKNLNNKTGDTRVMYASYTSLGQRPAFLLPCVDDGSNANPRAFIVYEQCIPPVFDVMSIGDDTNNVRHYQWKTGVTYAPDTTFTMPATWTVMPKLTVNHTHVPSNLEYVSAFSYAAVDGVTFEIDRNSVNLPPATASHTVLYAPNSAPALLVGQTSQGIYVRERYAISAASLPSSVAIDWSTLPVPTVTGVQQTATGLTWTQPAAGTADARSAYWFGQWVDGNSVVHTATWRVFEDGKSTSTTIALPTLPNDYAPDDPMQNAPMLRGASVQYADADDADGYDDARAFGQLFLDAETWPGVERRVHVSYAGN